MIIFKSGGIFTERKEDFSLEKAHKLLGSSNIRPEWVKPPELAQLYQKDYPECGAHAGCHLKQLQEEIETGIKQKFSQLFLWKKIKLIDGFPPEDGTDMKSILKCLAKDGVCDYYLLPMNYTETLKEHTDASVVTKEMEDNAQPRIISSYAFGYIDMESIKTQIWLNKAVLILLHCDDGFFGTDTPTFKKKPYGHFVTAIGYDKNGIYVQDSTEIKYPVKYIKNEYEDFIIQAGTTIDLPNSVIEKLVLKRNLLQKLLDLWKQLKLLK